MSTVRCEHLLIKHAGSRNPTSRRTGASTSGVTKEAARAELQTYLEKALANPNNFGALCKERSDCGSFAQNGDLGHFGPGQMQAPFEAASFALEVGQISGITDTDSGLHIIKRIE
eukprot:TRINITY_DN8414_c0_g1_i1.p2 TRINITY_DN8414_c0_g1~~TRINITY_DN8414_c0_g1_i1.p2  ORF type:complete len:115 (+),score=47.02 TRINITY_DN8414_c0_g1_i1:71-415(+)